MLENLDPSIAIERLFSRIPEQDAVFCNWGISWWKLKDEFEVYMQQNSSCQGKHFDYMNGSALKGAFLMGSEKQTVSKNGGRHLKLNIGLIVFIGILFI